MEENVTRVKKSKGKKALWGVAAFYLLIAFEIVYMAGPFAVYFYGVYNPVQNFLGGIPVLRELNSFFFPHIARETLSPLLGIHEIIGSVLAVLGFTAFLVGACQIYYSKFRRRGAVTGGIYNRIRHPQYVSFAVCGFGFLILWPRVINLLMFATMLFVYYLLAKAEERECEAKFGQSYLDYKNKTNMFLPFRLPGLPKSRGRRVLLALGIYLCSLVAAFFAAKGLSAASISALYATYTEDTANISLAAMENEKLDEILRVASADTRVAALLAEAEGKKRINYVMPTEWFSAEVPMNGLVYRSGHLAPKNYDDTQYKIVFTAVECWDAEAQGKDILAGVASRRPLAEVWVDLDGQGVTQVLEIPEEYKYKGIPVAVY